MQHSRQRSLPWCVDESLTPPRLHFLCSSRRSRQRKTNANGRPTTRCYPRSKDASPGKTRLAGKFTSSVSRAFYLLPSACCLLACFLLPSPPELHHRSRQVQSDYHDLSSFGPALSRGLLVDRGRGVRFAAEQRVDLTNSSSIALPIARTKR